MTHHEAGRRVHHAGGTAHAQHALRVDRQHAAHGDEAVLLLLDGLDLGGGFSHRGLGFCGGGRGGACAGGSSIDSPLLSTPTHAAPPKPASKLRSPITSTHLDPQPLQASLQALLEFGKVHRGARHQGRLLQEDPGVGSSWWKVHGWGGGVSSWLGEDRFWLKKVVLALLLVQPASSPHHQHHTAMDQNTSPNRPPHALGLAEGHGIEERRRLRVARPQPPPPKTHTHTHTHAHASTRPALT
jgi:hypothetical protein